MLDVTTILWLMAGFSFVIVAGALLGAGSHVSLTGMFPPRGTNDWPRGVQETDVPRFQVEHLDALRAASRA